MGTNFYMMTKSKQAAEEWFGSKISLTDEPDWGYSIHIAKRSCGWHPLFEEHERIHSVNDIKLAMETGEFIIYDEYNKVFTWEEFVEGVVNWGDENSLTHINPDRNMPDFNKIYGRNYSDDRCFLSADGYEFCKVEFS